MAEVRHVFDVRHNTAEMCFEIQDGDLLSELLYQADGEVIIFYHTYVPPALEGQGIGSQLAKAGLEYAKAKLLRVIPVCSFIDAYIRRHPEYQSLVRS